MRGNSDDPEWLPPSGAHAPDYAAVRRYVAGESDAAERLRIERWAAAHPDRQRYVDALGRVWARRDRARDAESDAAWAALGERMRAERVEGPTALDDVVHEEESSVPPLHVNVRRSRSVRVLGGGFAHRHRSRAGLAAAAAVLLATGLYTSQHILGGSATESVASARAATKVIETLPGQRATVTLADGSSLTLAPASRLEYAADFGRRDRTLVLEGEAHFVVAHDSAAPPFIVRAGRTETRDIGTAFAVRAYAGESAVRVVVTEGEVAMRGTSVTGDTRAATAEVRLVAGNLATSRGGALPDVRTIPDVGRYVAWTEGRLQFRDTPLPEAITELERWYGLTIRLADPELRRLRLTADLDDQSAPQLSRILAIALGSRIERDGQSLTLHRRTTP